VKKAVVADWQGASFHGIDLSPWITEWRDTRATGIAMHRYLKRDGGEAEDMGRDPHEAKVTLAYLGTNWRREYLRLQAKIDENPIGPLVHPIYGRMNAACSGPSDAGMNIADAVNLYTVPLRFIESAVDTKVTAPELGPQALQGDVDSKSDELTTAAAPFTASSTEVAGLQAASSAYAIAAVASSATNVRDPSLAQLLDSTRASAEAARAAVMLDPAASSDAARFGVLIAIEQLYDACTRLDDAVRARGSRVFEYTVPARIHVARLAQVFYPGDAMARIGEILANNARRLPDPGWIAGGTKLIMAPPTAPGV
jgi:hypothetical protein